MEEIAGEVRGRGERPYVIPYGGSNGIGALGYMAAAAELQEQLEGSGIEDPAMILASSSGGTQAGLVAGAAVCGLRARIMGISIDKGEREEVAYEEEMAAIANASLERAGWETRVQPSAFTVKYGSLGGGYGVVGDPEREAISLVARTDGILLDPVYTGRAMGALIAMIRDGEISAAETIIFWHTGGSTALFSYASDLL
jgi:D-cysteine desulfhydrase